MRNGVSCRSNYRLCIELLFRSGTVDAISDVRVGIRRLYRGTARVADEAQSRSALRLRRFRGRSVLRAHGRLDGDVDGRQIQSFPLYRRRRVVRVFHADIRRIKRRFPARLRPTDRQDPHAHTDKIRDLTVRTNITPKKAARQCAAVRQSKAAENLISPPLLYYRPTGGE